LKKRLGGNHASKVVLAQMVKFLLQATEVNYEPPASTLLVLLSGNSLVRPSYEGCLSIRKMTLETRCSRTAQLLHHTLGTHCHL